MSTRGYKVNTGGERWRHFTTLEDARAFCRQVFTRRGIVLAILEVAP